MHEIIYNSLYRRFMEVDTMLKVCLVGCGGISTVHIPAWEAIEDATLAALCDVRPEMMAPYPTKRHYSSLEAMLDQEKPDILDICLPTYLHTQASIMALERGIHVICEKPISLRREDVSLICDAAHRGNAKFMVAQVLRFWPEYEYLRQIFVSGRYGRLLAGTMSRIGMRPQRSYNQWMMEPTLSGMVPFDLHIHDLDFMTYAFGAPQKSDHFRAHKANQDYLTAVYSYPDFHILAEAAWYDAPYPFRAWFRFQFEDALVTNEGELTVYENSGKTLHPFEDSDSPLLCPYVQPGSNPYANEIRYFADCVRQDLPITKVRPEELLQVIDLIKDV